MVNTLYVPLAGGPRECWAGVGNRGNRAFSPVRYQRPIATMLWWYLKSRRTNKGPAGGECPFLPSRSGTENDPACKKSPRRTDRCSPAPLKTPPNGAFGSRIGVGKEHEGVFRQAHPL